VNGARRSSFALILSGLAALALCFPAPGYAQTAGKPTVDYNLVPKLAEMKDRPAAPEFTGVNPEGKKVSLKDFRGKVVFLNFWAT